MSPQRTLLTIYAVGAFLTAAPIVYWVGWTPSPMFIRGPITIVILRALPLIAPAVSAGLLAIFLRTHWRPEEVGPLRAVLIASITLAFCGALLMFAEDGLMGMFLGALAALEFFGLIVIPASIIVGFIGKYAVSVLTRRSTWTRRT